MKLDFESRFNWSFKMSNGDCEGVSPSNGIIIDLLIGDYEGCLMLNVGEKTVLRYREP